jgi:hypothetical protein
MDVIIQLLYMDVFSMHASSAAESYKVQYPNSLDKGCKYVLLAIAKTMALQLPV